MSQLSIYMQAIGPTARRLTAVTTALALVLGTWSYLPARAQPGQEQQQPGDTSVQLAPAQLDQLVAPIALYPDNLLGQILSASTYPLEVVMAARWSATNGRVTGAALENAMQSQPWDPSVKALTAVPQALKMMSEKLEWCQQLGEAYLSQPDDIAAAIQRLRARADASGNLKSSEQVRVKRVAVEQPVAAMGPEYIVIEPTYPERVYVPVYDPYVVYGAWTYPERPFYWSPPGYVAIGVIGFGAAVLVGSALWATYNWNTRRVYAVPAMYASFNRVPIARAQAMALAPLRHDPVHRGTLGYKNQALSTQYKTATPTSLSRTTNPGGGLGTGVGNPGGPKNKGGKPSTNVNVTNTTVINNNPTTNKVIRNTTVNSGGSTNIGNSKTGNTRTMTTNTGNTKTLGMPAGGGGNRLPAVGGGIPGGGNKPALTQTNAGGKKKH